VESTADPLGFWWNMRMSRIVRLVLAAAGLLLVGVVAACGTGTVAPFQVVSDFPVPAFSFQGELASVATDPASDAWAVGFSGPVSKTGTLMLHWDGAAWSRVTSPGVLDGAPGRLLDVTAVSAGDAWAVGYTGTSASNVKPLLLHWDGTRWSQAAGVPAVAGELAGIAVSGHSGWAVGVSVVAGQGRPLVLRWDGTRWHQVTVPPGPAHSGLTGVVATPGGTAWAVGNAARSGLLGPGVVLRWDGRSWHWASALVTKSSDEALSGVAAGPDGTVWAVGMTVAKTSSSPEMSYSGPPLSMRWTGAAWQSLPVTGAGADFLGVTVAPGGQVWAVGTRAGGAMTMMWTWTGSAWARVPFPAGNGPQANGILAGAAFSSSWDGWAVGTYLTGAKPWPLILHWDGTVWN
jgi:hypothetical protein